MEGTWKALSSAKTQLPDADGGWSVNMTHVDWLLGGRHEEWRWFKRSHWECEWGHWVCQVDNSAPAGHITLLGSKNVGQQVDWCAMIFADLQQSEYFHELITSEKGNDTREEGGEGEWQWENRRGVEITLTPTHWGSECCNTFSSCVFFWPSQLKPRFCRHCQNLSQPTTNNISGFFLLQTFNPCAEFVIRASKLKCACLLTVKD